MGVISQLSKNNEINVTRDHFLEVLALSAFGCGCGVHRMIQQHDSAIEVERVFHGELISDLIQSGVLPEAERQNTLLFIRTRLQEYHAVLAEHGTASPTIEVDSAMEGIGTVFEQACRGPQANHTPNVQDALTVLYLRHVAHEIFRGSLEATKEGLQGKLGAVE